MAEDGPAGDGAPDDGSSAGVREKPLELTTLPAAAACPFCGGRETEQFSAFGSQISTSQYYCRRCRTVFEYMKWRDAGTGEADDPRAAGGSDDPATGSSDDPEV